VVQFYLARVLGWESMGRYVTPQDVDKFKAAGGFNDDWDLACTLVLLQLAKAQRLGSTEAKVIRRARPTVLQVSRMLRESQTGYPGLQSLLFDAMDPRDAEGVRRLWATETIKQIYKEHFGGKEYCRRMYGFDPQCYSGSGFILNDRPLLRTRLLRRRPWKLGLYTGRTLGETYAAIELLGAQDLLPRESMITMDDGIMKPDPRGLQVLVERLGSELAIFCGDMPDDMEAVRRYAAGRDQSQPPVLYCHVRGGRRSSIWPVEGDIAVAGVNHLLKALLQ
jgi:HAD superfamily hydrolase (TIGR01548 family)